MEKVPTTSSLHHVTLMQLHLNGHGEPLYRMIQGDCFTFKVNPLLDLHYFLLYSRNNVGHPSLEKTVKFYKEISDPNPDFNLIFERARYPLHTSSTETELADGLTNSFREIARSLSAKLCEAYDVYLENVLPTHQAAFDETFDYLEKNFMPVETELFKYLEQTLKMEFRIPLPIYFVGAGTVFGAYTSEPSLTVINANKFKGSYLIEVILHESSHGFEQYNKEHRPTSAYALLCEELRRAGKSSELDALWHSLIFWNAGELVRKYLDHKHVHYGVKSGVYQRAFKRQVPPLETYWSRYLEGALELEQAIENIVGSVAAQS